MSEKIEPALSPEEWAVPHADRESLYASLDMDSGLTLAATGGSYLGFVVDQEDIPALIALANAALRDSDPRKITHEKLFALHEVIANFKAAYLTRGGDNPSIAKLYAPPIEELLETLRAYLPPE